MLHSELYENKKEESKEDSNEEESLVSPTENASNRGNQYHGRQRRYNGCRQSIQRCLPKVLSSGTVVTYPGNNGKGKRIGDGRRGDHKNEKKIRREDGKGKEIVASTQGVVIQNNFNMLNNITEEEENKEKQNQEGNIEIDIEENITEANNNASQEDELLRDNVMKPHEDLEENIEGEKQHMSQERQNLIVVDLSQNQQQLDNIITEVSRVDKNSSKFQLNVSTNENGIDSFPPERENVVGR
ncbi:hypothetical protein K7X08_006216 [Anisodus acutangulus]|uniref:Uncharacterized protein n=1 Tax=Anisodus acutangulus TaxID=402998 RepID=A0A9Q1RRF5_9SOLA|nr:hypothetical protein K7X08_006216 [Anisodus acutangulus]